MVRTTRLSAEAPPFLSARSASITPPATASSISPLTYTRPIHFLGLPPPYSEMPLPDHLRDAYIAIYTKEFELKSAGSQISIKFQAFPFFRELTTQLNRFPTYYAHLARASFAGHGSELAALFNQNIKPNDSDFHIRYFLYIDVDAYAEIPLLDAFLQDMLHNFREAFTQTLQIFTGNQIFDMYEIRRLFCTKQALSTQRDCFSVIAVGKFEVKFEPVIVLTKHDKIVRVMPGLTTVPSVRATLETSLDPFITGQADIRKDIIMLSSEHHHVPTIIEAISKNIVSGAIDGGAFFHHLKHVTFTGCIAPQGFLAATLNHLLSFMPLQEICSRLNCACLEQKKTNHLGAVCLLLNVSLLNNALDLQKALALLLFNCAENSDKKSALNHPEHFVLYLEFYKVLFAITYNGPYQLLKSQDPLALFIHFFETLKKFPEVSPHAIKQLFPQVVIPKEPLAFIIEKAQEILTTSQYLFLSHYLLFNFPSLCHSLNLQEKLTHSHGYLSSTSFEENYIPLDNLEQTIQAALIPHDPYLAAMGLQLLVRLGRQEIQWAIQFAIESQSTVPPGLLPDDILAILQQETSYEDLILKFAETHPELSHHLYLRAKARQIKFSKPLEIKWAEEINVLDASTLQSTIDAFATIDLGMLELHPLIYRCIKKALNYPLTRTQTKKLIRIFCALPSSTEEIRKQLCAKLAEKIFCYPELIFDLLPCAIREGLCQDTEFADLFASHLLSYCLKDQERLLHMIKGSYKPPSPTDKPSLLNEALQKSALALIQAQKGLAAVGIWVEVKKFIYAKALVQQCLGELFQGFSDRNQPKECILLLNRILSNDLHPFLEPLPDNPFYIYFLTITRQLLTFIETLNIGSESDHCFKCCINCLHLLAQRKSFSEEEVMLCKKVIHIWSLPGFSTFSTEHAHKLLSIMKINLMDLFDQFTQGCIRARDSHVEQWIASTIRELAAKGTLSGPSLAKSFFKLMSCRVSTNTPHFLDDLLQEAIDKKFFDATTPPEIWLNAHGLALDSLLNGAAPLKLKSAPRSDLMNRYSTRVRKMLTDSVLLPIFLNQTYMTGTSPFVHMISGGVKIDDLPDHHFKTMFQLLQNLFTARINQRLSLDCIHTIRIAFESFFQYKPHLFGISDYIILAKNFHLLDLWGAFESNSALKMPILKYLSAKFSEDVHMLLSNAKNHAELFKVYQHVAFINEWYNLILEKIPNSSDHQETLVFLVQEHANLLSAASTIFPDNVFMATPNIPFNAPSRILFVTSFLQGSIEGLFSYIDHELVCKETSLERLFLFAEQELASIHYRLPCKRSSVHFYTFLTKAIDFICLQKTFSFAPRILNLLRRTQLCNSSELSVISITLLSNLCDFGDCQSVISDIGEIMRTKSLITSADLPQYIVILLEAEKKLIPISQSCRTPRNIPLTTIEQLDNFEANALPLLNAIKEYFHTYYIMKVCPPSHLKNIVRYADALKQSSISISHLSKELATSIAHFAEELDVIDQMLSASSVEGNLNTFLLSSLVDFLTRITDYMAPMKYRYHFGSHKKVLSIQEKQSLVEYATKAFIHWAIKVRENIQTAGKFF